MLSELMENELNIDKVFIKKVAARSDKYYKHFTIPRRNGSKRDIHHPSPILKTFQYWLVSRIFNKCMISCYATAYLKGCSIKNNAERHIKCTNLVHLDIRNFFPSIQRDHLEKILLENKKSITKSLGFELDAGDNELICGLALFRGCLTIGSVSSPIISNIVMNSVDERLASLAAKYSLIYSRYCDDMVFSSKGCHISNDIVNKVCDILSDYHFELNNKKTFFSGPKDRKVVTGVNVNNDRLTVGRKKRDEIKKMVYEKCQHEKGDNSKILGNLSFLKDIDPWYYNKIIIKYPRVLQILKS